MALLDRFRRRGRKPKAPERETEIFPRLTQLGQWQNRRNKPAYKPTNRNLRYFGRTPYARRAINAIKNPISQLSWEIVPRRGADASSELDRQIEIVARCLENPNADDSFRTMTEQVIEDLLHGAGAIEQQVGGDPDRPLWLWPVDGLSIEIYPAWTGDASEARYLQTIGYGSVGGGRDGVQLRDDELIYIRPNPSTSQPFGTGPLEIAFSSISRLMGVGEYAGNVASNAKPSTILFLGEDADDKKIQAFRAYWRNEIEGQGITPITGGTKPDAVRLAPDGDAALYLQYQELLAREIAIAFDLSPQNLGVERDVNRNTSETAEDRDWDQAIKPWAHLLASAITRQAIHRRLGFYQIEFRFIGLDREDEQATADIYQTYYKNNLITPNQQLEKLGMPRSESVWGDRYFADVQIAMEAARSAKTIRDPDLPAEPQPEPGPARSKPKQRRVLPAMEEE